jgi:hypothetical protein
LLLEKLKPVGRKTALSDSMAKKWLANPDLWRHSSALAPPVPFSSPVQSPARTLGQATTQRSGGQTHCRNAPIMRPPRPSRCRGKARALPPFKPLPRWALERAPQC